MIIKLAELDKELRGCFPVILQLRPNLKEEEYIQKVKIQQKENYHIVFIKDKGFVKAVAGFRIANSLAWGKFLYVDDLITDEENRSKGYGEKLFKWLVDYAVKNSCQQFHLDSGVQRFGAHRFYLKHKLDIVAHHFGMNL